MIFPSPEFQGAAGLEGHGILYCSGITSVCWCRVFSPLPSPAAEIFTVFNSSLFSTACGRNVTVDFLALPIWRRYAASITEESMQRAQLHYDTAMRQEWALDCRGHSGIFMNVCIIWAHSSSATGTWTRDHGMVGFVVLLLNSVWFLPFSLRVW